MINIQQFTLNAFMVNSYLLWDETLEAILIDAACSDKKEEKQISETIRKNNLKLIRNLNTHCHIDHVVGNEFIASTYGINPEYHQKSAMFFHTIKEIGSSFGFNINKIPQPRRFLEDGEIITWGTSSLQVLYTPGHADGSVCFYNAAEGFVITGDVLFKDTIGRTDLPSGDFDQLMASIKTRLFTLPDDTVVYPGHGPETSTGYEKVNNPFIR